MHVLTQTFFILNKYITYQRFLFVSAAHAAVATASTMLLVSLVPGDSPSEFMSTNRFIYTQRVLIVQMLSP